MTGAGAVTVDLPRGRTLTVRDARRDDVSGLVELYDTLEPDARYLRFFSVFRPDDEFVERLTAAAERGGVQLVAIVSPPQRVVAEIGYSLLPNGVGEIGMTVSRRWRGWLGPYLLEQLVERAAANGVAVLGADILATNRAMWVLLSSRGAVRVDSDEWSVTRLLIGTTGTTPTWPARDTRRRLLVEAPGGRWHGGSDARAAGFDVLVCAGPTSPWTRCPVLRGERCPLVTDADAVVCRPADDAAWHALEAAHASRHADIAITYERRPK